MEAKLEQFGDLFVCHMSGRLDYHTVDPFKEICLKRLVNRKVIFNLSNLSFVGSVGIGPFLETMAILSRQEYGSLKFCGVQTEFRRVFEVSDVKHVEIFEDEQRAKLAFQGYAITPINSLFLDALSRPDFEENSSSVEVVEVCLAEKPSLEPHTTSTPRVDQSKSLDSGVEVPDLSSPKSIEVG